MARRAGTLKVMGRSILGPGRGRSKAQGGDGSRASLTVMGKILTASSIFNRPRSGALLSGQTRRGVRVYGKQVSPVDLHAGERTIISNKLGKPRP